MLIIITIDSILTLLINIGIYLNLQTYMLLCVGR